MATGAQVVGAVVSGVSSFGLTIATISTVGNSIVDLTKKRILDGGANKTYMLTMLEFINLCIVVPLMLWTGDIVNVDSMPQEYQIYLFVGVISGGVGKWFHAYSISLGGVALTVPFITLSPVVSVLLSMELNNEYPESKGIFGVLMICTGAAALALAKATNAAYASKEKEEKEENAEDGLDKLIPIAAEGSKEEETKRNKEVRAIIYMLITSVLWAVAASLQKKALKVCPFVEMTVTQNSVMFVLYSVLALNTWRQEEGTEEIKKESSMEMDDNGDVPSIDGEVVIHDERLTKRVVNEAPTDNLVQVHPRRLRRWAEQLQGIGTMACCPVLTLHGLMHGSARWYILTGLVEAVTVCLYFLAMKYLYVSYLLALKRGGSVVLSVAGGAFFFGEPVTQKEQLCIALMFFGVCFVVLS